MGEDSHCARHCEVDGGDVVVGMLKGMEAGSLDGRTVSKSTERKYGQVMDGMEEVKREKISREQVEWPRGSWEDVVVPAES